MGHPLTLVGFMAM